MAVFCSKSTAKSPLQVAVIVRTIRAVVLARANDLIGQYPAIAAIFGMCVRGHRCNLIFMKQPVACCSPEVMGGTAVFYGTRVPVQTLRDYLEAGETIDDFLKGFPSVTREQVIGFLKEAKDRLIETVS